MIAFDRAFDHLIGVEGGYVNDPSDRGGETKYGITKRSYPDEDIRNLTLDRAKYLYKRDFWDAYLIESYPIPLWYIIFDMYVNHNPSAVGYILQRAINNKAESKGRTAPLEVDGRIGPKTKKYIYVYEPEPARVLTFRAKYYVDIINRNPDQSVFFYGWMRARVFEEYKKLNL